MHRVASTKEWFENVGRHKIWAGHKPVALPSDMGESSGGCGTSCGCGPTEETERTAESSAASQTATQTSVDSVGAR